MASSGPGTERNRAAFIVFGALLCVLLAVFAIERRVAAYPTHNVAAKITAATGLARPDQVTLPEPQSLKVPTILFCVLSLLVASETTCVWRVVDLVQLTFFATWRPTPLAVRPPPAL